jgi:hypothetical protein
MCMLSASYVFPRSSRGVPYVFPIREHLERFSQVLVRFSQEPLWGIPCGELVGTWM